MNYQIVISGVGGQGVLFVTGLLAKACMDNEQHVLTSETHGMAQRGGTVISHLKVGDYASPLIRPGGADLLIVLKAENLIQHRGFLKPGGKAVVNSNLPLEQLEGGPLTTHSIIPIDADSWAQKENNPGSVNLYMLGAAMAVEPVCTLDNLRHQIATRFKGKDQSIKTAAITALETGFDVIS